jgi:predicted phage terminase large subunit-like protein
MLRLENISPTQARATQWLSSLSDSQLAALSPGALGMYASKGSWKLYRHMALFNRVALAIAGALVAGTGFNLIVSIQPQIGKSEFWSKYFPAWIAGNYPDRCIALSSYEANFAASKGRAVRDLIEEIGPEVFGVTVRQDARAADDWQLQDVETGVFRRGGMITTGVGGPLTGRPVDIGIVDDPIKNAEEAASQTHLDKIFDWYDSVFSSRFREGGVRIIVMTRWNHKDLVGRIKERAQETGEPWTEIALPAIAEKDEDWPEWGWKRAKGEVVCPELYSLPTMEKRRLNTLAFWWATMYLQAPYPREGGEFKSHWFQIVDDVPHFDVACRSWDLAGSEDKNAAQTAGVFMGRVGNTEEERKYYITDIRADWWASGDRDKEIKQTAQTDGKGVKVVLEQEPGSGGKAQAEAIARQLDGWDVKIVVAGSEGSKQLRADPMGSAAKVGKVFLKKAPWNEKFLEQIRRFPGGKPIDMVDGAAQAFNWLSEQPNPLNVTVDEIAGPERDAIFDVPEGGIFT